jgi:hypothetical protein
VPPLVLRGRRPPGRCDRRFEWASIFAAVEPATGADVALVLPEATTAAMNLFLATFAAGLPGDVHAALVLDGAGRHGARGLAVPANVTLVPLPPYSPELVWGFACQALIAAAPPISAARRRAAGRWPGMTTGGEPAPGRGPARHNLVSGRPATGPDHDAAMRIDGEAPGRRAHSQPRREGHVPGRVAATSDRHRRSVTDARTGTETVS